MKPDYKANIVGDINAVWYSGGGLFTDLKFAPRIKYVNF